MSFDLTVAKEKLVGSIAKAVSFLPNSSAGRTSVIYFKPQDGRLRIAVSFPDATFSTLCDVQGEATEDVVAVPGKKFSEIVKQTNGAVQMIFEGSEFVVRCPGAKWVERPIRGSLTDIVPPEAVAATIEAPALLAAFQQVQYVASKETAIPSLYAVDVVDGLVRSSNGANYQEFHLRVPGLTFQVSNSHVESFIKLLKHWKGTIHFRENEASYYFQHDNDILIMRKLHVPFPDLDRLLIRPIKVQAQSLLKVRKVDMEEVLRKVRVSSSPDFPYVEIHMGPGEMLARCLGEEGVEAVGKIEAVWNEKPRVATFNTNQLYSAITNQQSEILEIRFAKDTKDRKSPLVMEGEDSWSLLTQLKMRPRS